MITINKKIQDEYKLYEMLVLASSKANIYAKSAETEKKKRIVKELETLTVSKEDTYALYPLDNLLDYIMLVKDEEKLSTQDALLEIIGRVKKVPR